MRMRGLAQPSPPVVRRPAPSRQVRLDSGRADRQQSRHLVGDVAVVGVEPVERVVDAGEGAPEVARAVRVARVVDPGEAHGGVGLVAVGRALGDHGDRHLLPVPPGQRAELDDAVPRAHDGERQLLRWRLPRGGRHRHTLVVSEGLDRHALRRPAAVVDIARRLHRGRAAVGVAQPLHHGVHVVAVGAGRGPCVVGAVTQLDDELRAGERHAARVDARTLQCDLREQLRREVARLRSEDDDRVMVRGVPGADE